MKSIQILLDEEAYLSYEGTGRKEEREQLHTAIRLMRTQPAPACFGEDDCSTSILSRCPWRIDCGS
jgi:hypothetical protein